MFNYMKKLLFLPLLLLTLCGTAFAQRNSIVGKWAGEFPGQDGKPVKFTMTITDADYQFDFGNDGVIDIKGSYIANGDELTVWDTDGQNTCPSEQKGVYRFALDGDQVSFTKVKDDCPQRGGETMVLTRM